MAVGIKLHNGQIIDIASSSHTFMFLSCDEDRVQAAIDGPVDDPCLVHIPDDETREVSSFKIVRLTPKTDTQQKEADDE